MTTRTKNHRLDTRNDPETGMCLCRHPHPHDHCVQLGCHYERHSFHAEVEVTYKVKTIVQAKDEEHARAVAREQVVRQLDPMRDWFLDFDIVRTVTRAKPLPDMYKRGHRADDDAP